MLRIVELFTRKVCILLKRQATFERILLFLYVCKQTFRKLYGLITQEFLGLRIRNFQGVIFIFIEHIGRFSNLHQCAIVPLSFNFKLKMVLKIRYYFNLLTLPPFNKITCNKITFFNLTQFIVLQELHFQDTSLKSFFFLSLS